MKPSPTKLLVLFWLVIVTVCLLVSRAHSQFVPGGAPVFGTGTSGGGGAFTNWADLTNIVQGVAVTASTATNIAVYQAQILQAGNPHGLLNPPHIGPSETQGIFGGANSAGVMISGAGIVRNVWLQCELGSNLNMNTNLADVRLEVFTDGGNTTNLAHRKINVSLADLFGNRFRFGTNGPWATYRDSFGINSQDMSTNALGGGYIKTMLLRLPMPFSNYCLIRLTNSATGALYNSGYISATYERASDLSLLGAFQHWRLKTLGREGPINGSASNFLFSATGAGLCVGWLQGLLSTNSTAIESFIDGIAPSFVTSPGTTWVTDGFDDITLSTYAMKGGVNIGFLNGIVNFGSTGIRPLWVESYRWFTGDAVYWTNGVTVYVNDGQPMTSFSANMLYYAP